MLCINIYIYTINSEINGTLKGFLLAHFEDTLDFSRYEFTCTYIIIYGYVITVK